MRSHYILTLQHSWAQPAHTVIISMCDTAIIWGSIVPPFHSTTQTIKVEAAVSSEILILPINEESYL